MTLIPPQKSRRGLGKRAVALLLIAHLLAAGAVLAPFLPGPGSCSRAANTLFSGLQLLSMPLLVLVPAGLLWQRLGSAPRLFPLLVWTLPLAIAGHVFWTAPWARGLSRSRAIARSAPLLRAVAAYRDAHGHYPRELAALGPQCLARLPGPGVLGVAAYTYEPHRKCFQLVFTQNVVAGFNFEVVAYDPLDHHRAKGELSALYPAGAPHWRYYIYD